jgi:hypothetical protein
VIVIVVSPPVSILSPLSSPLSSSQIHHLEWGYKTLLMINGTIKGIWKHIISSFEQGAMIFGPVFKFNPLKERPHSSPPCDDWDSNIRIYKF